MPSWPASTSSPRRAPSRRSTAWCALFVDLGFAGNVGAYYDPRNSYLNEVVTRRTGIPITPVGADHGHRAPHRCRRSSASACPGTSCSGTRSTPRCFVDPFVGGRLLDVDGCVARRSTRSTAPMRRSTRAYLDPVGPPRSWPGCWPTSARIYRGASDRRSLLGAAPAHVAPRRRPEDRAELAGCAGGHRPRSASRGRRARCLATDLGGELGDEYAASRRPPPRPAQLTVAASASSDRRTLAAMGTALIIFGWRDRLPGRAAQPEPMGGPAVRDHRTADRRVRRTS